MHSRIAYNNLPTSSDWGLFFDEQIDEKTICAAYERSDLLFVTWTTDRMDGNTLLWTQFAEKKPKEAIMVVFPFARWYGSTSAFEEHELWFGGDLYDNTQKRGRYRPKPRSGLIPARKVMEETCWAIDEIAMALQNDEDEEVDEFGDPREPATLTRAEAAIMTMYI